MNAGASDFTFMQNQNLMNPDREITDYKSYQQFRFNAARKETQDITITTDEGDKVTISALSGFKADYMAFDYSEQVKGKIASMEGEKFNFVAKHAFQMSVEGDLNEEEREDIEKVLGELDAVMKDLVSGDLESIMERVPGIMEDTESLESLNAVLKFSQRVTMEQRSMTQEKLLSSSNLVAKITNQLMDIIEESKVDAEELQEPVKGYFSQLLDKMGMESGEDNPMTRMLEQLNSELLNRLEA
ncbi:MAG: hypothetical protein GY950_17175 [bacterium]|nr:hypothetical protein [bacterium]